MSDSEADDQRPCELHYGHGRTPLVVKLVWAAFVAFAIYYGVRYLLESLGEELTAR